MPERKWKWAAFASYVALAVLIVGPRTLAVPGQVSGMGVDLPGTIWMHWWVRTTVEHLSLPITSNLLFYPDGKNFFNDTGANFIDAYLGVPLQWIFGVPDFIDPLNVLVLLGNALAMYLLAYDVTGGNFVASWAAAAAFELNPYAVDQISEGRPTQAMLWFALLATRQLLRIERGTWKDGALFGLYTVLQGLTYWFMVYFLALALLPIALVALFRSPKTVAPRLALAVGVAMLIAAPFLLKIHGEIVAGNVRRLGYASWRDGPAQMASRWRISKDSLVNTTWLVALGLCISRIRTSWPWLLGVGLTVVFSLGAQLDITTPSTTNPFFIFLFEHVPMIPRLGFPERVLSMTFVLLAMGVASGLTRVDLVWALLFCSCAVAEAGWRGDIPVASTGYSFPVGNEIIKEKGGAVIFLPFGSNEDAMVFQTRHGQPLFGGMGEREVDLRPDGYKERLHNTFIIMLAGTLNDTQPPIGYTLADREAISKLFRWVWMDRRFSPPSLGSLGYDRDSKVAHLTKELGEPVAQDATFALWDLTLPIPADAPGLDPKATLASHELERMEGVALQPNRGAAPKADVAEPGMDAPASAGLGTPPPLGNGHDPTR